MTTEQREAKPAADAAWWAETPAIAALDFGLATSLEDFDGAFRLLHDRYVWRRYMPPETSGRRVGPHNLLPSTKVIVARAGDQVVGTVTVLEDSCLGLPMDEAFAPELGRLRQRGRRLSEVASLAVNPPAGVSGVAIVVRLLRLAIVYATRIARCDWLCSVVRPRHRHFYPKFFPVRRFDGWRSYRRVNGAEVLGFCIDLRLVRALIRMERAGLSHGPGIRFVCGPQVDEITTRLRQDLPRTALTPPDWGKVFAERGAQDAMTAAFLTPGSGPAEQRHR